MTPTRKIITGDLTVRSYELGPQGFVDNATFINYLEEVAIRASAACGYNHDWFEANQCLWLINKWLVRYHAPAYYGDVLQTRSWVSDFRTVQSHREYELLRGDQRALRARANWVFVDRTSLRPKRLLPEFHAAYAPSDEVHEDLRTRLKQPTAIANPHRFEHHHTVHYYELDRVGHANNANYFRWVQEATLRALMALGVDPAHVRIVAHEMSYKNGAVAGDQLVITSWVPAISTHAIAWQHEIRHTSSGDLVASDYILVEPFGHFVEINLGEDQRFVLDSSEVD